MIGNLGATAVAGLVPVATAWLLREILDSLAASHDPGDNLAWLAVGLAVASGVQIVLPELSRYCAAQSGRAIERLASHDLYLAVGSLDGQRLEDPQYQDQLNLAGNAGQQGAAQLVTTGFATIQAALTITGFIGALLVLNPVLAIIVMAAAVPGAYLELGLARRRATLLCAVSR